MGKDIELASVKTKTILVFIPVRIRSVFDEGLVSVTVVLWITEEVIFDLGDCSVRFFWLNYGKVHMQVIALRFTSVPEL